MVEGCSLSLFHSLSYPLKLTFPLKIQFCYNPALFWMMLFVFVPEEFHIPLFSIFFAFHLSHTPWYTVYIHVYSWPTLGFFNASFSLILRHGHIFTAFWMQMLYESLKFHQWKCEMTEALHPLQNSPCCRICPSEKTKLFTSSAEISLWIHWIM